jgi:hypothetical protein
MIQFKMDQTKFNYLLVYFLNEIIIKNVQLNIINKKAELIN